MLNPVITSLTAQVVDLTASQVKIQDLITAANNLAALDVSLQAALAAATSAGLDQESLDALQSAMTAIKQVTDANNAITVPAVPTA